MPPDDFGIPLALASPGAIFPVDETGFLYTDVEVPLKPTTGLLVDVAGFLTPRNVWF